MPPKRNNMIPNGHFHKDWQRYVKNWFNQPARKERRYQKRKALAAQIAPRPIGKLRPVVRCPNRKYNRRTRMGKGFTIMEMKAAGVCKREAMNIGISVDYKRKNHSVEGMQANVQRLKAYKSKLILFPANKKKLKKLDSSLEECAKAQQTKPNVVVPMLKPKCKIIVRPVSEAEKNFQAFKALRGARKHAKTWGMKAKKAREAAEDAAMTKK